MRIAYQKCVRFARIISRLSRFGVKKNPEVPTTGIISLEAKVKIWPEIVPIFYPQQPAKWIQLKVEVFVWNVTFIDFDCYPLLLLLYCYGIWWRIVAAFWRWRQSCNPFHERIRAFFPNKLLMTVLAWKNSTDKCTFLFLTSFYVTIFFILDTKSFQVSLLFFQMQGQLYLKPFLQFEQNGF